MTEKLSPFASAEAAYNLSKVGKSKSPQSLAARMPTRDIASKVGGGGTPVITIRRVVRRSAQA